MAGTGMLKCSGQDKEVDLEGFVKWSNQFPAIVQAVRAAFAHLAQPLPASEPPGSHAKVVRH